MAGRLDGKVALITGGSKGIGLATAQRFLREGARVAISARGEAGLGEARRDLGADDSQVLAVRADVANEEDMRRAVDETVARFGALDVLVANAGVADPHVPIAELELDAWRRVMATNVDGLFLSAKYAIPALRAQGGGSIVVVASDSSFVAAPIQTPYCTSKGAALMFTRALAVELKQDKIRVNCVCPSVVDTPMVREVLGVGPDKDLAELGIEPVHRAEDIAAHILFLASDEAATISGTSLLEDFGGLATSTFPF